MMIDRQQHPLRHLKLVSLVVVWIGSRYEEMPDFHAVLHRFAISKVIP